MRVAMFGILAACGRIGIDPAGTAPDASTDATTDAPVDTMAGPCSTAELVDDFEDGVLASRWSVISSDEGFEVDEATGSARVTFVSGFNVGANEGAGLSDSVLSDYAGRCITVEIEAIPTPPNGAFVKVKVGTDGDHVGFDFNVETISSVERIGGVEQEPAASGPYDPVAHAVLRIRADDLPSITLETAPTLAGPFVKFGALTADPGLSLDASRIEITAQTGVKDVNGMNEHLEVGLVGVYKP